MYTIQHIRPQILTISDGMIKVTTCLHQKPPPLLFWERDDVGGGGRGLPYNTDCLLNAGPTASYVGQCCRNMQTSFCRCLGIGLQKVSLGFQQLHRKVIKKYFEKSKNYEKNQIMICAIHYFITKFKTKIDVIL